MAESAVGDQAAFARLFTTYFMPVYRYVRGRVPMEDEAKDITHLVFYRLWTRRVPVDTDRPLFPLLRKMAWRAVIDYLRHERVEIQFARHCWQTVEFDGLPAAPDDSENELLRRERMEVVTQALGELSPRQREAMVLRWREQLSYDEIGRRLGVSPKTVAMHLSRAMAQLRNRLPDMYDFED